MFHLSEKSLFQLIGMPGFHTVVKLHVQARPLRNYLGSCFIISPAILCPFEVEPSLWEIYIPN